MVIVIEHPDMGLFAYLVDKLKNIFIKNPSSITSIEPFHKRILGGFPRLDILKLYPVHLALVDSFMCYELRSIVHLNFSWFTFFIDKMVQYANDTIVGQGKVNLNMKCFPIKIIDDVE